MISFVLLFIYLISPFLCNLAHAPDLCTTAAFIDTCGHALKDDRMVKSFENYTKEGFVVINFFTHVSHNISEIHNLGFQFLHFLVNLEY